LRDPAHIVNAGFGVPLTKMPELRYSSAGVLAYWYGPPAANGAKPLAYAYVTAAAVKPGFLEALAADVAASGPSVAIKSRFTIGPNDPAARAVWCPYWPEMVAGMNIPPPAPVATWTVAKNGTSTTRPAYTLTPTGLVASSIRATVGAACDCTAPYVKSGTTYCPFTGAPASIVAVCSKP
jgi:hypothetical protein